MPEGLSPESGRLSNVDRLRIGVDIGGTFTDFTVTSEHGDVMFLWKEETTPDDLSLGVLSGMRSVAEEFGLHPNELLRPRRSARPRHDRGDQFGDRAERAATGLLCTKGFRDVLYFRDAFKPERFNIRISASGASSSIATCASALTERIWSDGSRGHARSTSRRPRSGRTLPRRRRRGGRRGVPLVDDQPGARAAGRGDPPRGAAGRATSSAHPTCCPRSANGSARPRPR